MSHTAHSPPPWNWDHHPPEIRAARWQGLLGWVSWLEREFATWVELPHCWPAHHPLVDELKCLWYWHDWLWHSPDSTDPVAVLRWHEYLRRAAAHWRKFSCRCTEDLPVAEPDRPASHHRDPSPRYIDTHDPPGDDTGM